jgi:hypothetical protein
MCCVHPKSCSTPSLIILAVFRHSCRTGKNYLLTQFLYYKTHTNEHEHLIKTNWKISLNGSFIVWCKLLFQCSVASLFIITNRSFLLSVFLFRTIGTVSRTFSTYSEDKKKYAMSFIRRIVATSNVVPSLCNKFTSAGGCKVVSTGSRLNMQYQCRGFRSAVILCEDKIEIKENSWAQEGLLQKGEKLAPLSKEDLELIECTRELYDNPSPKVKRMADEVLSLNVLEVNQLLQLIQVRVCVVAINISALF